MNQHSDSETIQFYNDQAEEYIRSTIDVVMSSLYEPFLRHIPEGGMILDAGCGSGRDSKAFLDRGYPVVSIDSSQKMVDATAKLTGQQAHQIAFQEIRCSSDFDGIWACASLLHVPMTKLADVLDRFAQALRPSGICYVSFKYGEGERWENGRLFTDMNEQSIRGVLNDVPAFEIIQIWRTDDLRPERSEQWLNLLVSHVH